MTQVNRTQPATDWYVAAFQSFSGNGGRDAPSWLRVKRGSAMDRFADAGFPKMRQEAWRFTDVRPIAERAFTLAPVPEGSPLVLPVLEPLLVTGTGTPRVVFVNGHYAAGLSSVGGLPSGVELGSLRAAIQGDHPLVLQHLMQYASTEENPFTALSTAFTDDGAFVRVPADVVVDTPLHVVFVAVPSEADPVVFHPRNLFIVESGAKASVVESYVTLRDGVYWTNVVTEVVVEENASLDAYRLQRESTVAYHTATTQSYQKRDSNYSFVTFAFGSALSRHDINAVLDGEGAGCTLNGLSVLSGRQHVDHHTTLDHAQPHCDSWEYFNGVFDERARGVFTGRIIVRPGAQRTDSKQTNNNLLLSERARADSQPQLEIYADDVKCTHGATLGPIDERKLFYLQSRGLALDEARRLLTYGFGAEILNAVRMDELRGELDCIVREQLAENTDRKPSA